MQKWQGIEVLPLFPTVQSRVHYCYANPLYKSIMPVEKPTGITLKFLRKVEIMSTRA